MTLSELVTLSPRVKELRQAVLDAVPAQGRSLVEPDEARVLADCVYASYIADPSVPPPLRRARLLSLFSEKAVLKPHPRELIVGSQRFGLWRNVSRYLNQEQLDRLHYPANHGHIVVDYTLLLTHGIDGMRERIRTMPPGVNRDAMALALDAFSAFIRRHADAYHALGRDTVALLCRTIATNPPSTFREALQLVWFTQIFLHAEGMAAAVSFGRFDQILGPFLQRDLERRTITLAQAFELVCCFFLKTCEGDESQNMTLGGESPAGGANGENLLSLLALRAMTLLRVWQPSLSVRIGPYTSESFWQESLALCSTGIGMPSFFNEPVVTHSLGVLDIPPDRARDWGIVGCYEATPQGDSYPLTVGAQWPLPQVLLRFLDTPQALAASTFSAFFAAFSSFLKTIYRSENLPDYQQRWNWMQSNNPSPFESVCVRGCLESGKTVEAGGSRFNLFGVNILGIGTVIDSLLAVDRFVFKEKAITLLALVSQLKQNFPDEILLERCRRLPGKYGSDSRESNSLACQVATLVSNTVLAHPLENGVRPDPGLFWFGGDIHQRIAATPDGRRDGDFLSYGCGPGLFLSSASPTSILNSVAHIPHDRCANGNPLTLSLNRSSVSEDREHVLRQLIETYFRQGGFHLHVNLVGRAELAEAQENPERHRDLVVRISGFSTVFVTLDKRWQDAIIARTEKGL